MNGLTKGTLFGVLGLVGLGAASVATLLGSESGGRWLLARVPGVEVQGFSGHLGGQWQAERLTWRNGEDVVRIEAPRLDWSPGCLLRMSLCIDRLEAGDIDLSFAPSSDNTDSGPLALPDLKLPLTLELGEVRIASLHYAGSQQFSSLELSAQWVADGLHIDKLSVSRDDLHLELQGQLTPTADWPLQARANLQLPRIGEQDWDLALEINGDLLKTLRLKGTSSGYLTANLEGEVQALAEHTPARLHITSEAFEPSADLPKTLALRQIVLDASGDLAKGYGITGSANLPAEQGDIPLKLAGQVDAKGARIAGLDLLATGDQHLKLTGALDWQDGLSGSATVDWLAFPWLRLYPMDTPPQVEVKRLKGEATYRNGNFLGNLDADLKGPAGDFSLVTPFAGDSSHLVLPQLALKAGQGRLEGQLKLGFASGIDWDADLTLADFDPAYWVGQLPGKLAGPLRSKGSLRDDKLAVSADIDLKGRLRNQPAVVLAKGEGNGRDWTLGQLEVRLGDNRIHGSGSLQQRLAGRIDFDLPRLGQLWPDLRGQVDGQLDVAGTFDAPQGSLTLTGKTLGLGEQRLQSLALKADLDARQQARIDLKAQDIRSGDTRLGDLVATGSGNARDQKLDLTLNGPDLDLNLGADGQWQAGNWKGRLAKGEVKAGGQDWRLQAPAKLQRLANGQVDFGAHCWRSGDASLCGEDQRLNPDPKLRYHLRKFPLASLAPFMPKDFAWEGELNADVNLDLPASGPKGTLSVDGSGGTLRLHDKDRWLDFPYQTFNLTSQLAPRRVDTRLVFDGQKLGKLSLDTRIDPLGRDKPLSGTFSLDGLDLSVARPFATGVETLEGKLQGNGRLSGTLLSPRVDGSLLLSQGKVAGAELPTSVEDLTVRGLIQGERLDLSGTWASGKDGQGRIAGQLAWSQGLDMDLTLAGSRLPITVEPYAELEAAPDLHIRMNDGKLAVVGKVLVPKGAITVRQLPPSTVQVSPDTVIVGQQTEQGEPPLALAMDVQVIVGSDKLSFKGFGLTANLAGQVHVGNNLDTRGELQLKDGRYAAYGQKLTIRRARLMFTGPLDQPYLDIEAVRTVDDVIAGIRLTGSAEQPQSEVFSEPAMSQEQALSYLVLGRPLDTSGEDNNMLAQAALGLGLAGSAGVTGKLANQLGIQDFSLDTQGTGDKTSVVASGAITDKLSLRYGVGVFEPANTIALRYLLSKKVYVEAAGGLASSLDIFYKRDF